MTALPECPDHPGVTLEAKTHGWFCDGGTHIVSYERVPRPGSVPLTELQAFVLQRYPFPIAWGFGRMLRLENPVEAVDHVFYAYTATLRFGVLVLMSEFLHGTAANPTVARALGSLESPSLEQWYGLLNTLGRHLHCRPAEGAAWVPFAQGGPFSPALVDAILALPGLRHEGLPVHDRLRDLRNLKAHDPPWDERQCRQRLPEIRSLLERVLSLFAPLASLTLVRCMEGGRHARLVGEREVFTSEPAVEAALAEMLQSCDVALVGPGGECLALEPLFLGPVETAEGYLEPMRWLDRKTRTEAVYLGVRSKAPDARAFVALDMLLRGKDVDPAFKLRDLKPWMITDWARSTTRNAIGALTGTRYFPAFYVARTARGADGGSGAKLESVRGVDDEVGRWLASSREPALLVVAEAGSGKTSLLCRVAEALLEDDAAPDCVLLVTGAEVRGDRDLFDRIRAGLGMADVTAGGPRAFAELLDTWRRAGARDRGRATRRLVLLVDAVNESSDAARLLDDVAELAAAAAAAGRVEGGVRARLLVSIRGERIETLRERWESRSDAPLLRGPENFAHFVDERGRSAPYLTVRRFSGGETRQAWQRAQRELAEHCPARFEDLSRATRELLRHPLMQFLFHRAHAGVAMPPEACGEAALWEAWLTRTFDPGNGGGRLEGAALALADECLDGGHAGVPRELLAAWRAAWERAQSNDPVQIAANTDEVERMCEAGLLRRTGPGEVDWVSDALAEQVLARALVRRDPELARASVEVWLRLPTNARVDGALVRVGVAAWETHGARGLVPLLRADIAGRAGLTGKVIERVAPRGPGGEIRGALTRFDGELEALFDEVGADPALVRALGLVLGWHVDGRLSAQWGATPALSVVRRRALEIAERLAALEPQNPLCQRELSVSFGRMGELELRQDPVKARGWFERSLEITERLVALEPQNPGYLHDLSVGFTKLGDLDEQQDPAKAEGWFARSLEISVHLASLEPQNPHLLQALSIGFERMGALDRRKDPSKARRWFERSLEFAECLVSLDPQNPQYLRVLSISFDSMGELELRQDTAKARRWFERSLEIAERLVALDPQNIQHQHALSVSFDRMGNLDLQQDPGKAREWFERSLEIRERLMALEPQHSQYLRYVSISLIELGDLDLQQDPGRAREWFERSLEIRERLVALEPQNPQSLNDLSIAFDRMGELHRRQDSSKAEVWFARSLEITEHLVALQPQNLQHQQNLSVSLERMGNLDLQQDPAKARGWLERSLEIRERLVALEPQNLHYQHSLSVSLDRMGDLDLQQDSAKAWERFERSLEIAERLVMLEPQNVEYRLDLSIGLDRMGDLDLRQDPTKARERSVRRLELRARLVALDPQNTEYLYSLSLCLNQIGVLDFAQDPMSAREWFARSLKIRELLVVLEPQNTAYLRALSTNLGGMGEVEFCQDPAKAKVWFCKAIEVTEALTTLEPESVEMAERLAYLRGRLTDC